MPYIILNQALSWIWMQFLRWETLCVSRLSIIKNLKSSSTQTFWWKAEEFVLKRQDYRIPVGNLAKITSCSRSTLHRACIAATGDPPIVRLRSLRMEQGQNLLAITPISIADIAKDLGYSRPQEFSREFKSQVGMSPSLFRQAHHNVYNVL